MTQNQLPTLGEAAWIWLRIGCLSFGGPAAQIALMHRMLVEERKWIGEARFLTALNYCMLLPGPEAQQLATYIGWLMHGVRGGLVAGLLFILPGSLVIMALSVVYLLYAELPALQALFYGLKCAVLAIVLHAVLKLADRNLVDWPSSNAAYLAFLLLTFTKIPFPIVLAFCILISLLLRVCEEQSIATSPKVLGGDLGIVDRIINSGPQAHMHPSPLRTLITVLSWLVIWLSPVALAFAIAAEGSVWREIALFFSQTAALTFGGAYAILPHVAQTAVETHEWLSAKEMMHGLALAETTPGPLILVLQYVGFLAAAREGGLNPVLGGVLGGALATWVTFAPSFLWIFAGAPFAERLQAIAWIRTCMAAIGAAVVGVIAHLAFWLAMHVVFTQVWQIENKIVRVYIPDLMSIDVGAVALSALAAILVLRFKWGVVPVLAICAALGMAVQLTTI
jgi:chromate transporter